MPPKKNSSNGYSLYMMKVKNELAKKGIHKTMADMAVYCSEEWKNMSAEEKAKFKAESKRRNNEVSDVKYTSIGEKVEDIQRQSDEIRSQENAMYQYIEELVRVKPANYYLPKHKFILIYINPYSCESERYYFPAELTMAEFSLEKGLIRIYHQLLGFDQHRTNAPFASAAEIVNHAKNYHLIVPYSTTKLPNNYTEVLLKIIGFMMNKDVDETVLNDPDLDMPPIYTAHSQYFNELMTTTSSLYQLYQSCVKNADRDNFNKLFKVYHLDKLLMEMKNVSYKIRNPETEDKALPSVAMASESLSKDMLNVILSFGCNFHEKLESEMVCSNFYVCKWIYIFSIHCCQFFDIKLIRGCHYDFKLSSTEFPPETLEANIEKLSITQNYDCIFNKPENNSQALAVNSFPALDGNSSGSSTFAKKPTWSRPELKVNTSVHKTLSNKADNFPPLGNVTRTVQENSSGVGMNWGRNAGGRGGSNINQVPSSIRNQSSANAKTTKGIGGLNLNKK